MNKAEQINQQQAQPIHPQPEQPQNKQSGDGKPPVSREYTRQVVAEAGLENLPEEQYPDVFLDIPTVKVDEIKIEVDNLDAQVAINAELANLLKLNVGAHVSISKVEIDIVGVEAQAILKVRLKQVNNILSRALDTLDRNPDILNNLLKPVGEAVGHVGSGLGKTVGDIGPGLGKTIGDLGPGLSKMTGDIGGGLGKTVGDLGPGLSKMTGDLGGGLGKTVGELGPGLSKMTGELGGGLGKTVGELGPGLSQATGDLGKGLGKTTGEVGTGLGQTTREVGK
jgi:hypothetical protein